jgi:3',5'-cyclic-AMP phosphodiesterase
MAKDERDDVDRRGALECMIWAGAGVLWTMAGGVPRSSLLGISEAKAQAASGFTFLQISDSHIGFKQAPNPNPLATLEEAIAKVDALPQKPAFMIHTGDITHLSKPEEFDNADQVIGKAKLETFYVPGEHDIIDENLGKAYLDRYAKRTQAKAPVGIHLTKTACILSASSTWRKPQGRRDGLVGHRAACLARRRFEG